MATVTTSPFEAVGRCNPQTASFALVLHWDPISSEPTHVLTVPSVTLRIYAIS